MVFYRQAKTDTFHNSEEAGTIWFLNGPSESSWVRPWLVCAKNRLFLMKEPTPPGGRAVLVLQTGNTFPFLTSSVPEKNPLFPFAFFPLKFGRRFVTEQPAAVCKVNTFLFTPASTCSAYAEWSCEVCLGWWRREWGRRVFLLNIKIKRTWGQKATLFLTFTWLHEKQNQSDNETNSTSELFKTMSTSHQATLKQEHAWNQWLQRASQSTLTGTTQPACLCSVTSK